MIYIRLGGCKWVSDYGLIRRRAYRSWAKAAFPKVNVNSEGFDVFVDSIKYIGRGREGGKETVVCKSATRATHRALSYNSSQSILLRDMLTLLCPLLGIPSYDKGMNRYVYTHPTNRLYPAHNTPKQKPQPL